MKIFLEIMFVFSFILLVTAVIKLIYQFVYQRDVMLRTGILNLILVIVVISIGLAAVIYYFYVVKHLGFATYRISALFFFSLFYFLMTQFAINQANALKYRAVEILETVIGMIESGDPNLKGHSLHVLNLTMLFYNYLPFHYRIQLNEADLRLAALFLDLGKLGIPREILMKSGKLTEEEYQIVKHHPEHGAKILRSIGSFDKVAEWILYHHERFDGSGYHHLKGAEIPLASRIIAVADTYSALIMDRSYKASMTYEDAVAELKLVTDTQLDKELVDIFYEIPKSKVLACFENTAKKMEVFQLK